MRKLREENEKEIEKLETERQRKEEEARIEQQKIEVERKMILKDNEVCINSVVNVLKAFIELLQHPKLGGPGRFEIELPSETVMGRTSGGQFVVTCYMYNFGEGEPLLCMMQNRFPAILNLTKECFEAQGLSKQSAEALFKQTPSFREGKTDEIVIRREIPFVWSQDDLDILCSEIVRRMKQECPTADVRYESGRFYFNPQIQNW